VRRLRHSLPGADLADDRRTRAHLGNGTRFRECLAISRGV
jgi:hypothetical protein